MAYSYLGTIVNRHQITDVIVGDVAANVKLTAGLAVYEDTTNGFKVVPTSSQPIASNVRFVSVEADNTGGAKGDKKVETYKHGAIIFVKAEGNIPLGSKLRCSTSTAGSLAALADPANAALNATFSDTEAEAAIDAVRDVTKFYVADYLGHADEFRTGKEPTAATDGQEIAVYVK